MTTTERIDPPWRTGRWTPLGGGRWKAGMRAEYTAEVGTPDEIAASMTRDAAGPMSRTIRSGTFTDRSPRQFAMDTVAKVAREDHRDPTTLAAVVWDPLPFYADRTVGERNDPRNPNHALDVYTDPEGGDVGAALRTALLSRLRVLWEEDRRRQAVTRLWELTRNIRQVHQVTGVARSTIYRWLRADGHEPTDRSDSTT